MNYGNEQSMYTMNRAAYGDVAAGMMMGASNIYGGAAMGASNMLSDIGQQIMPIGYVPPARAMVGFHGMYQQQTGMMRGAAAMLGLTNTPRSMSASQYGYNVSTDFGERVASGVVGAAAVAGETVMGMGAAAGIGKLMGGGLLGTIGGGLAGFGLASMATQPVMNAINQRRDISNFLESSSFRFAGTGSNMYDPRTGGMNRGSRQETANFIRQMDFKDPTMDTRELTQVLQQGAQSGMFTGTKDMDTFKKKFKDLTDSVKVVTKTLNQTLEEGMKTLKDLKSIGVDPSKAGAIVSGAETFGRMAGKTASEMLNLGMQGAELFRGTGVNMGIGAQATMMNQASIRAARDAGTLSSEAVMQGGGEEALAMRMTASGMAFGQSTLGRGYMAAFSPGGQFNSASMMGSIMSGGGNLVGNAMMAAGNMSSPAAMIAFQANQAKSMTEMGKMAGGKGLQLSQNAAFASQAGYLSQNTGAKFEDSLRYTMQQQGIGEPEIETRLGEIKGNKKIYQAGLEAISAGRSKAIYESSAKNNSAYMFYEGLKDKVSSAIDVVAKPLSNLYDSSAEFFTNVRDKHVYGVESVNISEIPMDTVFKGRGRAKGKLDLSEGGMLGGMAAGEKLAQSLTKSGMAEAFGISTKASGEGSVKLRAGATLGENVSVSEDAIRKTAMLASVGALSLSTEEVDKRASPGHKNKLIEAMSSGKLSKVTNFNDLLKAVHGKDASMQTLSSQDIVDLRKSASGTRFEKLIDEAASAAGVLKGTVSAVDTKRVIDATKEYSDVKKSMDAVATKAGGNVLNKAAMGLVAKAMATDDPAAKQKLLSEAALVNGDANTKGVTAASVAGGKKDLGGIIGDIQAGASQVGANIMARGVAGDVALDKLTDAARSGAALAVTGIKDAGSLEEVMKGTHGAVIRSTAVGRQLGKASDLFKNLDAAGGDQSKIRETLRSSSLDPDHVKKILATTENLNVKDIKEGIASSITKDAAGKTFSTGSGATDTEGTKQLEALDKQVEILSTVQQAMEAIAKRLGK